MPELPEVQTTVNGLRRRVIGLTIKDVWSGYNSAYFKGSETIKDPEYFMHFKKEVLGRKIKSVERRAKNILINLDSGSTILVHMKMTGHLMYGLYKLQGEKWQPIKPASLKDPFNRHIRLMFTFTNGRNLALADTRKFAKVTLINTEVLGDSSHLLDIGPEPLDPKFDLEQFNARLDLWPTGRIKQVLTDQSIIAGIGNIYADEALWRAGIHPERKVSAVNAIERKELYKAVRKVLESGIDFGGDSMSDYRNIDGEKGQFQEKHCAYRRTGKKCLRRNCSGTIRRIKVGGRSSHYCDQHQAK